MPNLVSEHTKRRGRYRRIESQPTAFYDKLTKCEDLKTTNRSNRPNFHWPFDEAKSKVIDVGRGWRDLILKYHCRCHFVHDTRNQTLDQRGSTNLGEGMIGSPLLHPSTISPVRREEGVRCSVVGDSEGDGWERRDVARMII